MTGPTLSVVHDDAILDVEGRCESYILSGTPDELIADGPVDGSERCEEPASWRVSFSGHTTGWEGSALRLKCDDCAEAEVDCFGEDVTLRRL